MLKYDYTKNELHVINRSTDRNLPNDCEYCIYKNRPSGTGNQCSTHCKSAFKK